MEHKVIGINNEQHSEVYKSFSGMSIKWSHAPYSKTVMVCTCGFKTSNSALMQSHIKESNK